MESYEQERDEAALEYCTGGDYEGECGFQAGADWGLKYFARSEDLDLVEAGAICEKLAEALRWIEQKQCAECRSYADAFDALAAYDEWKGKA